MKKVSTAAAKQSRNFCEQRLTIGLDLGDRSSLKRELINMLFPRHYLPSRHTSILSRRERSATRITGLTSGSPRHEVSGSRDHYPKGE
jgi:hypothetical protein